MGVLVEDWLKVGWLLEVIVVADLQWDIRLSYIS